jgi:hypothetical protein
MIGRKRQVGSSHDFGERLRVASFNGHPHDSGFTAACASKNYIFAGIGPAHKMSHHSNVRQAALTASIRFHYPDL